MSGYGNGSFGLVGNQYGQPIKKPSAPGSNSAPKNGGFIFQENPYGGGPSGDIKRYEDSTYNYEVQTLARPDKLLAQNYDPLRQQASQTVDAGVQSGMKTGMSQLAASGGLSAADRQAIQAQGQRQQVGLGQGSQAAYDQMSAQNMYDTNRFNVGQEQSVLDYNQMLMNERAKDVAAEAEKKAKNIYDQRMREAMLERQLQAAREIAMKQGA